MPSPTLPVTEEGKTEYVPNPDYATWEVQDQQVLSFLLTSFSREILAHVANMKTAHEVWVAVNDMFASHARSRVINTWIAMAQTPKGNMSVAEYIAKMKAYADDMASAGRPLEDEDLVSYICASLDLEFNPLVAGIAARDEPITVNELYAQLLGYEQRMELLNGGGPHQVSVNTATRGGRGYSPRGRGAGRGGRGNQGNYSNNNGGGNFNNFRGRGNGGNGRGRGNTNNGNGRPRPTCQICGKVGHTAAECWHRFEEDYVPQERSGNAATTSYGVDTNWYMDTGATDHITGDLERLTVREKYNGHDQVHTASGTGNEENSASR